MQKIVKIYTKNKQTNNHHKGDEVATRGMSLAWEGSEYEGENRWPTISRRDHDDAVFKTVSGDAESRTFRNDIGLPVLIQVLLRDSEPHLERPVKPTIIFGSSTEAFFDGQDLAIAIGVDLYVLRSANVLALSVDKVEGVGIEGLQVATPNTDRQIPVDLRHRHVLPLTRFPLSQVRLVVVSSDEHKDRS
jgi:hypothetical protein